MTTTTSIDQHIEELNARLKATSCRKTATQIFQELFLCELYAQTPEGRREWERNPDIARRS